MARTMLCKVTRHKRTRDLALEPQTYQHQRLASLGILTDGVAHDLNNLLTAVYGNLDLARSELRADHPAQEALADAERTVRHASDLTRQLMAYAGKSASIVRPVNLSHLVDEMAQILRVAIGKPITFDLRLDPTLPLIQGDGAQLQQIVLNLLTNASEAIGKRSGTITLTTNLAWCDASILSHSRLDPKPAPGRFVSLKVTDTGVGMDEATCERLFEPFFTTKADGRGLGMAVVFEIVRSQGGAIMLESTPGRGTTITVLFPPM